MQEPGIGLACSDPVLLLPTPTHDSDCRVICTAARVLNLDYVLHCQIMLFTWNGHGKARSFK